jgi:hypothetical protein
VLCGTSFSLSEENICQYKRFVFLPSYTFFCSNAEPWRQVPRFSTLIVPLLQNLLASITICRMKLTKEELREARRLLASAGGKARAKKYNKKTLSKWAKKGGRPRKKEGA